MNVSNIITRNYEYFFPLAGQKNKPNSNPIKPNLRKAKMNVNLTLTKDYRKNDDFAVRKNKPKTNPIAEKGKIDAKCVFTKDYEDYADMGHEKTNPNKPCPELVPKVRSRMGQFQTRPAFLLWY